MSTTPFSFNKTSLDGLISITPFYATDERGALLKDYSEEIFQSNGLDYHLKETFYTISYKGVVRAIHFQHTREQAKLVRVISGSVFDVVVDLRPNSKTFGKWEGFYLNDKNRQQLFIPEHFGHGYLVLEDSIVSYKCNEKFYGEYDSGIFWRDPDIGIDWPTDLVNGQTILSEKDENLQSFNEFCTHFNEKE